MPHRHTSARAAFRRSLILRRDGRFGVGRVAAEQAHAVPDHRDVARTVEPDQRAVGIGDRAEPVLDVGFHRSAKCRVAVAHAVGHVLGDGIADEIFAVTRGGEARDGIVGIDARAHDGRVAHAAGIFAS